MGSGVLISTLKAPEVLRLTKQPTSKLDDDASVLLAYVYFYDARGGGVETSFKDDKQGLGITKRNKKRYCQLKHVARMFPPLSSYVGTHHGLCPHSMGLMPPHSDLIPHIPSVNHPKMT